MIVLERLFLFKIISKLTILTFPLALTCYLGHGESVREGVLVDGLVKGGVEWGEGEGEEGGDQVDTVYNCKEEE